MRLQAAGQTKWTILQARLAAAQAEVDRIERDMSWMERTTFGRPCSGCGTMLDTEADFAQHFIVPNELFSNLGSCPNEEPS